MGQRRNEWSSSKSSMCGHFPSLLSSLPIYKINNFTSQCRQKERLQVGQWMIFVSERGGTPSMIAPQLGSGHIIPGRWNDDTVFTIVVEIGSVFEYLLSETLPTLITTKTKQIERVRKSTIRETAHSKLLCPFVILYILNIIAAVLDIIRKWESDRSELSKTF